MRMFLSDSLRRYAWFWTCAFRKMQCVPVHCDKKNFSYGLDKTIPTLDLCYFRFNNIFFFYLRLVDRYLMKSSHLATVGDSPVLTLRVYALNINICWTLKILSLEFLSLDAKLRPHRREEKGVKKFLV